MEVVVDQAGKSLVQNFCLFTCLFVCFKLYGTQGCLSVLNYIGLKAYSPPL